MPGHGLGLAGSVAVLALSGGGLRYQCPQSGIFSQILEVQVLLLGYFQVGSQPFQPVSQLSQPPLCPALGHEPMLSTRHSHTLLQLEAKTMSTTSLLAHNDGRRRTPMSDEIQENAVNGKVWADFCDNLKEAGQIILDNSTDDLDRLEGFRYLSRLTRGELGRLENHGPAHTQILPIAHNVKIGCDNPDALYQGVPISGAYDYRIRGPRGTVNYLSLNALSGSFGMGGAPPGRQGALAFNDPQPGEQVDVIASASEPELEPGQRWLQTGPETNQIAIRNFYLDRSVERPSELHIECLNGPDELPPPLSAQRLTHGLARAALGVHGIARRFVEWLDMFQERPNTLEFLPKRDGPGGWGDPTQKFRHGYWILEPGQALVIDVPPIDVYYWNFQLNNIWEESLDYDWLQVTVNKHTAVYEPDGTARIIVADEDPGFANWIHTAYRRHGTMGLRYNQVVEDIPPTLRVMEAADLPSLR